ncbi:dephospho-CoA kinase [Psychroflexus tropicus]|uniref:dephospho-CoA kinase n=1 Tax=Psychroflexus tropicus TaxID=197345 RepID=UPI000374DF25|nr:dephospho-CoA kinase [Psychroflexus tropicus]
MIKVGLTGGIGSGKTTVAEMFEKLGAPLFIADREAKKILDLPEVTFEIADVFELKLKPDGKIHKPDLASIVFNDTEALEALNSIIHPRVHKSFEIWFGKQDFPYIIYEAAIIFEKDRASSFDYTVLVTAPKEERIRRVMNRDKISDEQVESRMKAQWPQSKKKKLANFIIENINLNETQQQVAQLHEKFLIFSDN